jgi:Flp pilus assembly protein TadD
VLVRHARLRPKDWVLRSCRLALASLLLLAAFFALVVLTTSRDMPPAAAAMSAVGALILALCLRAFVGGEATPFVRGLDRSYSRSGQPIRFWLSLGWNGLIGATVLFAAWGMTVPNMVHPGELACLDGQTDRRPEEVAAACTLFLSASGLDAGDRGLALGARADARARAGDGRGAQGDWRAALAAYGEALTDYPENAPLHFRSGEALHAIGDLKAAREAYDAHLLLEPRSGPGYIGRGLVNLDDRRDLEAVADFTKAADLLPGDAWPLANRGMAHAWLRNRAEAERDFRAARALDPNNQVVLRGEAMLALDAGDEERALERLTTALAQDPTDGWSANLKKQILDRRDRAAEGQAPATR